jgi:hypothetical protein
MGCFALKAFGVGSEKKSAFKARPHPNVLHLEKE